MCQTAVTMHNWVCSLRVESITRAYSFPQSRNFELSRRIWPLPRNFRVSVEYHGIPHKHGNSAAMAKFHKSVLLL